MKKSERELMSILKGGSDSFENNFGDPSLPAIQEDLDVDELDEGDDDVDHARGKKRRRFTAQFDVSVIAKYFTLNGGVYTEIAAAALNAALKNNLPVFLYGLTDYNTGFNKLKGQYSINANWVYGRPGIYGKDDFNEFAFDATVTATLNEGDLVIPFTSALPGAGTTTLALNIVRCNTVNYGSLLESLVSDSFVTSGIRMNLDDATQIGQFSNQISVNFLSLFGKFKTDVFSPNSYKDPKQFQNGIVDIPIKTHVNKNKSLTWMNLYTNVSYTLSMFVWSTRRLK